MIHGKLFYWREKQNISSEFSSPGVGMWQVGVAALLLPCHTITGNLLPDEAVAEVLEQVEDSQAGVVVGVLLIVVTITVSLSRWVSSS